MPVLTARRASFGLGDRAVLHEVDLQLRAGEVTAVIGVNGSGKTTLLQGLAGLLPPFGGEVSGGPAALVFQRPEHQFVARDGGSEIGYGLRRAGVAGPERELRVREVAAEFGLADLVDRDPFRLSGGEQRRLSVASMVVLDRPVLLLDEPTFAQDRTHALAVGDRMRALARGGAAVLFSSHDLRLVGRVADRVIVLGSGRVAAAGPTATVLADVEQLAAAGLTLPPLLEWWRGAGRDLDLRALLDGLRVRLAGVRV